MTRTLGLLLAVAACTGSDPADKAAPVPGPTPTAPVTSSPAPTTPPDTVPAPVPVPGTHFQVRAEGVFDDVEQVWKGWGHPVDGSFQPFVAVDLLDASGGEPELVCTVTMTATGDVPLAAWADTELGVWAAFDAPADAEVSSDCDPVVAAQIARIGWGMSVGLLDGPTAQAMSEALPAVDWATLSLYMNGGGVRSPSLVLAGDHPTGFVATGTALGYHLTRHGDLEIDDTGNWDPIDKNDVLRPGGVRRGYYRMESQILGPAERLVR